MVEANLKFDMVPFLYKWNESDLCLHYSHSIAIFFCKVEFNPLWNQKKLREYCKANGVLLIGYSPLGASGTLWGSSRVLENEVLKEIAEAKGKTVAQICLKWAFEEGVGVIVKSFNVERMKQNLEILDWSLSEEERKRIGDLPQSRGCTGEPFVSENGTFKTIKDFWDGEV
uniref:NADP-dependent oxidoreductase domain-containing protein n=1 Tax=Gossypium raimondii TaxID=29730 RepID=A0A0D2PV89_GOSRA|nr:hypothetical protein B456_005G186800 [Gossypium raimondii]